MLIEINLTQLQGKQNIKSGCDEYYLHIQPTLYDEWNNLSML